MGRVVNVDIKGLEKALAKQVDSVMKNLERELLEYSKDVMEEVVYDAGSPKKYIRTRGLKDSLDTNFQTSRNASVVEIYHTPNYFVPYQDDSVRRYYLDNPNFMPKIVHEGLSGSRYGMGFWRAPRPYFTHASQTLQQGDFKSMFENEYRRMGGRLG